MNKNQLKKKLKKLDNFFSSREEKSVIYQYDENKYFAIRLDGVRFTKKYISKEFIPNFIVSIINDSIFQVYKIMFRRHNHEYKNLLLAIIQVNDEITFIFNKGNNKYNRRTLKILSLINGSMSSWTTSLILERQSKERNLVSRAEYYDARPIILNNQEEIHDYIEYRYLLAKKHALAKTLKFNKIKIKPFIWENISLSNKMVKSYNLKKEFHKIENTFSIFIPDKHYHLKQFKLTQNFIKNNMKKKILKT